MSDSAHTTETFRCCVIRKSDDGIVSTSIEQLPLTKLPEGNVRIRVQRSSLNYKDALAVTGHPGIVRSFPHVPGIDAAGVVVESSDAHVAVGSAVITTGHELGVERWGGWSEFIQVPSSWVLPLPGGLSFDEAMAIGTAGFTAAQCVEALIRHDVRPDSGEVLVTGATGGVACLSIQILSQLGYRVVALTGKADQTDWLQRIGATRVMLRDELLKAPNRPLLKAAFVGAVDTVGGEVLSAALRMIHHRGCVAACGVAGGADLAMTVYPFILRGITLAGIDSAWCPDEDRPTLWQKLAGPWKPRHLMDEIHNVTLEDVIPLAHRMLSGLTTGRTVVSIDHGPT
jgi:acrylyl-CoA reductase (NADPH)